MTKRLFGIILLSLFIGIAGLSGFGEPLQEKEKATKQVKLVRADQDILLKKHETSNKKFEKMTIGRYIVYRHERKIGEAIVEGDFIRYKFDANTKRLLDKKKQWRSDLPE